MRKPGVSRGTMNMVVPSRKGTSGLVRASMKKSFPTLALAMKHFSPFRIHSSPLRSARSLRPALGSSAGGRRLSEPAFGSLMPLPSRNVSSARKGLRNRSFCSSVHTAAIRWLHFQHWLKVLEMALSAFASSAITSACVTKSVPCPPHFLGTAMVRKPSLEPFLMISQSKASRGSGIASRASEIGRISSSANFRAFTCQERCSSFSEKSMSSPSDRFRDANGWGGVAAIARQRFGDSQLRLARAAPGMQAHERVVHVFLQRHVAHHAHGAEAFGGVFHRVIDRFRGEHPGDGRVRQIGDAAGHFEPDRDLGELRSDRLVLDNAPPALDAQLRVVERRVVSGAAYAEVQGLEPAASVRPFQLLVEKIFRRYAAILEDHLAAWTVSPALGRIVLAHAETGSLPRHE